MPNPTDPNPRPIQKAAFWARWTLIVLLAAAGIFELYGVFHPQREDTLSETTRFIFQTHTTIGTIIFAVFWVAFSVWFLPHIVKKTRSK